MIKIETWKVEKKHRVAREKIKEKYMCWCRPRIWAVARFYFSP
jgi:hypothetical protein